MKKNKNLMKIKNFFRKEPELIGFYAVDLEYIDDYDFDEYYDYFP